MYFGKKHDIPYTDFAPKGRTMEHMNRRQFGKLITGGAAFLAVGGLTLTTAGCNAQDTIVLLLNEMETDWQAWYNATGGTMPANIQKYFAAAVAAVQGWKAGSPSQDVVQALQLLSAVIVPLIPTLTPAEQALAQVVLGTVINLIEFIDPSAAPVPASSNLSSAFGAASVISKAKYAAIDGSFPGGASKGRRTAWEDAKSMKKDFETRWKVATKAA
jgi:hypothetical protein